MTTTITSHDIIKCLPTPTIATEIENISSALNDPRDQVTHKNIDSTVLRQAVDFIEKSRSNFPEALYEMTTLPKATLALSTAMLGSFIKEQEANEHALRTLTSALDGLTLEAVKLKKTYGDPETIKKGIEEKEAELKRIDAELTKKRSETEALTTEIDSLNNSLKKEKCNRKTEFKRRKKTKSTERQLINDTIHTLTQQKTGLESQLDIAKIHLNIAKPAFDSINEQSIHCQKNLYDVISKINENQKKIAVLEANMRQQTNSQSNWGRKSLVEQCALLMQEAKRREASHAEQHPSETLCEGVKPAGAISTNPTTPIPPPSEHNAFSNIF